MVGGIVFHKTHFLIEDVLPISTNVFELGLMSAMIQKWVSSNKKNTVTICYFFSSFLHLLPI